MLGLGGTVLSNGFVSGGYIADVAEGAISGYSVRRISGSYTGPCMRVRATYSPNDEYDVEFDNQGNIDFSGPAFTYAQSADDNLTIVKWYDQIGNNDLVQTVVTEQPVFYLGLISVPTTLNGRNSIEMTRSGEQNFTTTTDYVSGPQASSVFCVNQTEQLSGSGNFVTMINFHDVFRVLLAPNSTSVSPDSYSRYSISTNTTSSRYVRFQEGVDGQHNQQSMLVSWDGTTADAGTSVNSVNLHLNGSQIAQDSFNTNGFAAVTTGTNLINSHTGGNFDQAGNSNWQELIIYDRDVSSFAGPLHNNAKAYYNY